MPFKESNFEKVAGIEPKEAGKEKTEKISEKIISKEEVEEIEKKEEVELEKTRKELEKIIEGPPKEKKEKTEKGVMKKLQKLTAMIEQAIIERIRTNPDSLAVDKDFYKLDNRLISEAEILAKRYHIEDEVDKKGKVIKEGSEKILETIGYDFDEEKRYKGVRKGDLMNYERNALFKMWNLPADKNDIERFENKINSQAEKLAESKKFKGISKDEILKAIHFDEAGRSYKEVCKEDLLFFEHGFVSELNNLKVDKKGEIRSSGVKFLESPKSKWLKKAFAVGVPTLLFFSLYINAPKPGKEKSVSLKQLEENPDLMDKVYKKAIFKLIAPDGYAAVKPETTDKLTGEVYGIPINLNYHYDNAYLYIGGWTPPEYFEEMNKIGLHIDYKNSDIPLSFYLEHRDEVDKIIAKHCNISPEEMNKIDTLIKITELTEEMKNTSISSWDEFSVGEDMPENVKKIDDFRYLLKEGETGAIPSYDSNFTDAIDELLQKEGYDDAKLKEIAEKNPKEVISIIAGIIDKNVEYDYERAKARGKSLRGEPLSKYESSLLRDRPLAETLKIGGVCQDISDVVTATVEYMKSKEILPQNLLVSTTSSRFMDHAFNSVRTVDSSGEMVSTYIDVTWFAPEKVGTAPYLYDLDAVDYYHKLGISEEKIKEIMTARFSEYAQLTKDISTYDPWLHKRQREIIVEH